MNKRDKGGGGDRLLLLVAHLLSPPSHEGGSLNCFKTPPAGAFFPYLQETRQTRAIFSKSKEQTSQPAGKNLKSYFLSKSCSFLIQSWGFSQRCMLGFERGGLCAV